MWYATCCGGQQVRSGKRASQKGVTQEAMSGATATWNSWRGWDLSREPNLTRADLSGTNLSEANLSRADLSEAELMSADLESAKPVRANLFRADLMRANLTGANLTGADLTQADLSGADLSGADLSTARLTQEEVEPAIGDENTRLPPDIKPPAHWGVGTDEQAKED